MLKKVTGIALAVMLIGSTAAVTAGAAEADNLTAASDSAAAAAKTDPEAVGAADGAAVAAADGQDSVAAGGEDSVAAKDDSAATGAGNKIYFDANTVDWKNYKRIVVSIYRHVGESFITWGAKSKGNMSDNDKDGIWEFDLDKAGITLEKDCACLFAADWNAQTCNLVIGPDSIGDTAVCTGNKVELDVDSNKKCDEVKWKSGKYGNPMTITSIGNIVGDYYWTGENATTLLTDFLTNPDIKKNILNALNYNGKDMQKTIDDTAAKLGLTWEEVKKIVTDNMKKAKDAGIELTKWDPDKSSLKPKDGTPGSGNESPTAPEKISSPVATLPGGGSGGENTIGGNSVGGSAGSDPSSSVTTGEGMTVYLLLGGIALAAAGVIFLMRKRNEEKTTHD